MAWRFKASKYKNAAPIVPKPENCVREITVGSYQTYGNNIAASAAFMAFNVDHNGSSLGVLPLEDSGRKGKTMPLLHAHSDTVTDMDFSPFHDGFLATGSQDCTVKVWHIPEKGLEESLSKAEQTLAGRGGRRVECLRWHPVCDCLLTTASFTSLSLWDLVSGKELYNKCTEDGGLVQSISWKRDGRLLAFQTKEKTLGVLDPRQSALTHSAPSHQSIKDSRVVWLGDSNRILTTGFDAARQREVFIRDIRNIKTPEKTLVLDSSTGILIPLFDPDTSMLFLAGKGDTTISYLEVTEKEPYLVEGLRHSGEQTKGACLVPKRALNVMQAEVNRLLQLTSSSVIPISYQVPRKSYREFHSELYPVTPGCESRLLPSQWAQGADTPVPKISLNPTDHQVKQSHRGSLVKLRAEAEKKEAGSRGGGPQQKTQQEPEQRGGSRSVASWRDSIERGHQQQEAAETNGSAGVGGDSGNCSEAPVPTPRLARTCSAEEELPAQPPPRPRPRLSSQPQFIHSSINFSQGYKPRLGPKPFTPPKLEPEGGSEPPRPALDNELPPSLSPMTTSLPDYSISNGQTNGNEKSSPDRQPDHENNQEEEGTESSSGGAGEGAVDEICGLERGGLRTSIAERRRLYEARSMSLSEPSAPLSSPAAPSPLARADSIRASKPNSMKEEDNSTHKSSNVSKPSVTPTSTAPLPKRTSTVFGRVSKFRHLKGTPAHKSLHIENVRNVSRQISGECDGFHCNRHRACVPLGGAGGKLAVLELSKPGRLPDGVTPVLVNAANVMDFAWDPFNDQRLAVGCDDGTVKTWLVPETGLRESTNSPEAILQAHTEKIFCLKFHPLARDILATTSYDMTIKIWDLASQSLAFSIKTDDQVVSLAWSPCGRKLAAVSRGSSLVVYEPRGGTEPVAQTRGPGGTRGARIVWALEGQYIALLGFDKKYLLPKAEGVDSQFDGLYPTDCYYSARCVEYIRGSERQIMLYKSSELDRGAVASLSLDVSPAILIPFYDEDSSTLFCTGRGDSTIYAFEVSSEPPELNALSHHRCASLHQGLSFLPKNCLDVAQVEFARALRLTNTTIEPLSFTVPRVKSELFQDDLFPETKVSWEPTMSSEEWLAGANKLPPRISLKPNDMESLSEMQGGGGPPEGSPTLPAKTPPKPAFPSARISWTEPSAIKEKQLQIQKSVSSRVEVNLKLEQDRMEGVDETEWNENE